MGALVGLLAGIGLLFVWLALSGAPRQAMPWRPVTAGLSETIAAAGIEAVTPASLLASCIGVAVVVGGLFAGLSQVPAIGVTFAAIAFSGPLAVVRRRARLRRAELRDLWPDAIDNLASAVRAGMALPEALAQLGARGPEPIRPAFRRFGEDYRANGRFDDCLDVLKSRLADPTGDRVVESVRVARDVGGSDLGRLLRTLSGFLREEARTRAELQTRQGWVVNAARLAVSAPWLLLALMATRRGALAAYNSPAGAFVLLGGALVCVLAYLVMVRIGRMPDDVRVLR